MSIFQPVDVTGPAHRGAQIQQLAQSAAQNVMRRQRMRALLKTGAAAAGSARAPGGAMNSIRSSMMRHPVGVRGGIMRPAITAEQLAAMAASAGAPGTLPGGGSGAFGGMYSDGGGGYDFSSLPDPTDAAQSPQSLAPVPVGDQSRATVSPLQGTPLAPAPAPAPAPAAADPTSVASLTDQGFIQPGTQSPGGPVVTTAQPGPGQYLLDPPADPNATNFNGMIPLGGGMYYDPVTDALHGMPSRR